MLIEQITTEAFRDRAEWLRRNDPRFIIAYDFLQNEYLRWMHSYGVLEDPELLKLIPPFPPEALRSITGPVELPLFLYHGLNQLRQIMAMFETHRKSDPPRPRILDFGVGSGRLARFLAHRPDIWELHGSDVNPEMGNWCQVNLPGQFRRNEPLPPLSFESEHFDLIYALSVFSHLPLTATKAWLNELARLLKPGGVLVITTHGYTALDIIEGSTAHQEMFLTTPEGVRDWRNIMRHSGFHYNRYAQPLTDMAATGSDYGNSFISAEFLPSLAPEGFQIAEHVRGFWGWQDFSAITRIPDGINARAENL
jgi:Methylase of polypeptide chain release factors